MRSWWSPYLVIVCFVGLTVAAPIRCFGAPEAAAAPLSPEASGVLAPGVLALGAQAPVSLSNLDPARITTGILYDRVLPLSHIEDFDGSRGAKPLGVQRWKQLYSEMFRASLGEPAWPALAEILEQAGSDARGGVIPIAVLNFEYDRIRPRALEENALVVRDGNLADGQGNPYLRRRVFAATTLKEYTYRGERVIFEMAPRWYFSNDPAVPSKIDIDFADGCGFRTILDRKQGQDLEASGQHQSVTYSSSGRKLIRLRVCFESGSVLYSTFLFDVRALDTPVPDDTLTITSTIPYGGQYGSGEAYVYLSDGHGALTNPVIVVEGFDLDNTMNWEELYALLNQQGLAESLRTDGYDAVVLNFTDATDYIQKNAYVVAELIEQVKGAIDPAADLAIVGASMGGLAARYALAYMETNGVDHRTRTFISFDAPQKGANIPLGVQYWMKFFSSQSEDAAYMLGRLNTPAARQLLVYHLTDPPGTTGQPDPLRLGFVGDLATLGDYPADLRKVAVANGSGSGLDQGFAAGEQIVSYEYYSFLVDIKGNVWAVPGAASQMIFEGLVDRIWPLPDDRMDVSVSGTRPFDNAPGGWRSSMATMDSTQAPYGDIIALHQAHCFIPTTSALALDTDDLFYDIDGDSSLLAHTPFDTVYYPTANQEHVTITAESAIWFRSEIVRGSIAGVGREARTPEVGLRLDQSIPNPFNSSTLVRLAVPSPGRTTLDIYDVRGRRVARLLDEILAPGTRDVIWNGADGRGNPVSSGVYFCRVTTGNASRTRCIMVLR